MKKLILKTLLFCFLLSTFYACKSTKKGCGLTSDSQKVEQLTSQNNLKFAEV